MPDKKTQAEKAEKDRIILEEDYEVFHWSKKFGVSPGKLKEAVIEVGNKAMEVEKYLKTRK
jgi:hypothetical protein